MELYVSYPLWCEDDTRGYDDRGCDSIDVIESVPERIATGILNANGDPIFRIPNREPIGFRIR